MQLKESFKERFTIEQRSDESDRIFKKYPDRIPIIFEQSPNAIIINKHKFLVPRDLTVGQFMFIIRKRIEIKPEKALYIFFGNKLVNTSKKLGEVYISKKDMDGFLYCTVTEENTFG